MLKRSACNSGCDKFMKTLLNQHWLLFLWFLLFYLGLITLWWKSWNLSPQISEVKTIYYCASYSKYLLRVILQNPRPKQAKGDRGKVKPLEGPHSAGTHLSCVKTHELL